MEKPYTVEKVNAASTSLRRCKVNRQPIVMPALIIKSQHAAAVIQGVSLRDGSKVFKTIECRGPRCATNYRGSVAIFASKSYCGDTEDHYTWFGAYSEQTPAQQKRGTSVKLSPAQDLHFRAWSRYSYAWSYSLVGFAKLTSVTRSEYVKSESDRLDLHKRATDFRGQWMEDPPKIYLSLQSQHELTAANGPKFAAVCYGCNVADPRHNATACHVNWQTVALDPSHVPNHVAKEIAPWQPK